MIAGIEPCSFVDFPGRIAVVLFLQGCNLHCPYCHNPELLGPPSHPLQSREEVIHWLKRRVGRISGVVVTGGEPTLHTELLQLLTAICALGYQVKLDTNGTRPAVLRRVLAARVVDYVAMDVKDVPQRYRTWLSSSDVADPILESVNLLRHSTVAHEFRTTVVLPRHELEVLDQIRCTIGNESRWFLQAVNSTRSYVGHALTQAQRDALVADVQELRRRGARDLHWRGQEGRSALVASKCGEPDAGRRLDYDLAWEPSRP